MAAKQTKRRKHKRKIFYPVYWCLVILAAAAIAMMLRVLYLFVEDYEASLPKHIAKEVEQIFFSRDFETLYQYDDLSLCEEEGKDAYVEYMKRLTGGYDITCQEKYSASSDEKVYQIKYGNHKLAVFTLCKSGQKSKYGNELWMLSKIKSSVIVPQEYQIVVPETSKVYVDEKLLGADAVVEEGLELTDEYLAEGCERTKWQIYSVTRCFAIPKFEVKDKRGRDQSIIPAEQGRLSVVINSDDDWLRPSVENQVIQAAKAFAMFTSDDYSRKKVMAYVANDSKAEKYIFGFDSGWFALHRNVYFRNMRTDHYVEYDNGMISCNVYFDYEVEYKRTTETYPTAYTFFFKKQGDQWLIYDFITAM